MTDKNKLIFGVFFILFTAIGAGGVGWKWFLNSNSCDHFSNNIKRLMDNQDNLLLIYGLFAEHSLTKNKQTNFKQMIDLREPLIRANMEHFKENCKYRKKEILATFNFFEIYLVTKKALYKDTQSGNYNWLRQNHP